MSEIFENDRLDTFKLMHLLARRWKLLLLVGVLAFAGSVVVTSFMQPRFFSNGIVYPTSSNAAEDQLLNPQFGFEVHADRLMQILESERVRDSIIHQFDLITYYELDTNRIDWEYHLHKRFAEDVTFFRSKYMSIVISATTRKPELSANIVNAIIDLADDMRETILKTNTSTAFKNIEGDYLRQVAIVDALVDSIYHLQRVTSSASTNALYRNMQSKRNVVQAQQNSLNELERQYNVYDLDAQLRSTAESLAEIETKLAGLNGRKKALSSRNNLADTVMLNLEARISALQEQKLIREQQLERLQEVQSKWNKSKEQLLTTTTQLEHMRTEYATLAATVDPVTSDVRVRHLESQLDNELNSLAAQKVRYEMALSAYEQELPKIYVIDRAKPSYKKVSPSYSYNAMIATMGALVFTILILVFSDAFRRASREIKTREA